MNNFEVQHEPVISVEEVEDHGNDIVGELMLDCSEYNDTDAWRWYHGSILWLLPKIHPGEPENPANTPEFDNWVGLSLDTEELSNRLEDLLQEQTIAESSEE